jgi:hypothetical protein
VPEGQNQEPVSSVTRHLRKYYDEHYDPRGGYGQPLPGKYRGDSHALLNDGKNMRWFDVIEPFDGRKRWDAALGSIVGPSCPQPQQFGKGDGVKWFCPSSRRQQHTAEEDCHVISIGSNDRWHFEEQVADALRCTVHTFDCTLRGGQPRRKPDRDDIRFYNYCIHERTFVDTHGRQYLSYRDILEKAGLLLPDVASIKRPPVALLKIDVEGFEYDILSQMISDSASRHLLPQQIQVELHWATRMTSLPWMLRARTSAEVALFGGMMFHGGGYLPIHTDFNRYCSSCLEVLYFRAAC